MQSSHRLVHSTLVLPCDIPYQSIDYFYRRVYQPCKHACRLRMGYLRWNEPCWAFLLKFLRMLLDSLDHWRRIRFCKVAFLIRNLTRMSQLLMLVFSFPFSLFLASLVFWFFSSSISFCVSFHAYFSRYVLIRIQLTRVARCASLVRLLEIMNF